MKKQQHTTDLKTKEESHQDLNHGPLELRASVIPMSFVDTNSKVGQNSIVTYIDGSRSISMII